MNNLEKAKQAIKGERKFAVRISQTMYYKGNITAKSQREATEMAIEAINNDEWSVSNSTSLQAEKCEEIEN